MSYLSNQSKGQAPMDLELMAKLLVAMERLNELDGLYSWKDEEIALRELIKQETHSHSWETADGGATYVCSCGEWK
jgi:hypothetical protein